MNHREITEALFEASVRFDHVIYLAGALSQGDSLPPGLSDFLIEEDGTTIGEALPGLPQSFLTEDDDTCREFVAEWLIDNGRLGFMVQAATPVMTRMSPTSRHFSWGYYSTQWLYGDTMEEVVSKAVDWARERRDAEDAKAEEAKNAKGGAA